jgi:hypothetical protein
MKLLEKSYNGFIKFFGDIKVFKFPMFLIYDPGSYRVKGEDIREVINILQPGDILIRGYVNYLDGYFIPGFFSHAGLYIGKVEAGDDQYVKPEAKHLFKTGEQMVIHSMAEGVFLEDVINFCRCDYMAILRRDPNKETEEGKKVPFSAVFKESLSYLGLNYDFKFDFSDFHNLSCTELVYVSCKGFIEDYGVNVKSRTVLFMKKSMITPDDFIKSQLDLVWKSKSISEKQINKIKSA